MCRAGSARFIRKKNVRKLTSSRYCKEDAPHVTMLPGCMKIGRSGMAVVTRMVKKSENKEKTAYYNLPFYDMDVVDGVYSRRSGGKKERMVL